MVTGTVVVVVVVTGTVVVVVVTGTVVVVVVVTGTVVVVVVVAGTVVVVDRGRVVPSSWHPGSYLSWQLCSWSSPS